MTNNLCQHGLNLELNKIYQGNALDILKTFPDECIDCIITSPPYYRQRDYQAETIIWDVWEGHLGQESTYILYIQHLIQIFNELHRVLKKTGTFFLNIGDKMASSGGFHKNDKRGDGDFGSTHNIKIPRHKSMIGIPERIKIAMIDSGKWICRNTIIWKKPNCTPSSCKDNFTHDYEWIHFFVKQSKYNFNQQLEPQQQSSIERMQRAISNKNKYINGAPGQKIQTLNKPRENKKYKKSERLARQNNLRIATHKFDDGDYLVCGNGEMRNMSSVWDISCVGLREDHFASYPEKIVERCIRSGCPENGIILDPFMGSGTTALVAMKLLRQFIGIELNPKYIKMAERRIKKRMGLFCQEEIHVVPNL